MRLAAIVLLLLLACTHADAQTIAGGTSSGAAFGTASGGGGGGGIAGVEAACTDSGLYGSGGNCICSETLNSSLTITGSTYDAPDSPDTHECWGRFSSVWAETDDGTGISTTSVTGGSGWGTTDYALLQNNGSYVWAMAPIAPITSSTRTYCVKYFRKNDNPWNDDGTCRTKGIQMNFDNRAANVQLTTQSDGGSCSTTPKPYWLQMSEIGGGTNYTTTVYTNECDDKPCKIELCVDGEVLAGANLQHRARITSYEGAGEVSIVTSAVWSPGGGPSNQSVFGGDWWHSGGGSQEMNHSHFSVWAWDSDTDQWPPDTCEVEGGC